MCRKCLNLSLDTTLHPHSKSIRFCQNGDGYRHVRSFRWGLIPNWAKDPAFGNKMINARSETVGEKPAFRGPIRYHRCLIPATGFYEWFRQGDKKSSFLHPQKRSGAPGFCWNMGRLEKYRRSDRVLFHSDHRCEQFSDKIHDRMPVILSPSEFDTWLDREMTDVEKLKMFFTPFPAEILFGFPPR